MATALRVFQLSGAGWQRQYGFFKFSGARWPRHYGFFTLSGARKPRHYWFFTFSGAMSRPRPSWGRPHGEPKRGRSVDQTGLWEQVLGALPTGHGTTGFSTFRCRVATALRVFHTFKCQMATALWVFHTFKCQMATALWGFTLSGAMSRPGPSWGGPHGEPKRGRSVDQKGLWEQVLGALTREQVEAVKVTTVSHFRGLGRTGPL